MQLTNRSFSAGEVIPVEFAFAVIAPHTHVALSKNYNPHLIWSAVPIETKPFTPICHDRDVPSSGDYVNKEGRED